MCLELEQQRVCPVSSRKDCTTAAVELEAVQPCRDLLPETPALGTDAAAVIAAAAAAGAASSPICEGSGPSLWCRRNELEARVVFVGIVYEERASAHEVSAEPQRLAPGLPK